MRKAQRQMAISSILLAALLFALAFGAVAWRLDQAPDIFTDEILYTRAGVRVAAEGALVWDTGRPLVIHPPLYFLLESVYLEATSQPESHLYVAGGIFEAVTHARLLNAFLAGMTAVILFWLGSRLHGRRLGLLLAILFLLDPFGMRTNRRAMLETLAGLLTMAGMGTILSDIASTDRGGRGLLTPRRALVGGGLLGAALLTKDLAFTAPLSVALFGLWEWWRQRREGQGANGPFAGPLANAPYFLAAAVAGVTALIVPLWALIAGHWERFARVKVLALQRLAGLVQLSGWNRPQVSFFELLLERLGDYGSTYLLLGLGGVAIVVLLLLYRRSAVGRFLAVWGMVLYPFYAFVAFFGSGNDQFFYYLLLPAIVFVGYTATVTSDTYPAGKWALRGKHRGERPAWQPLLVRGFFLGVILSYNLFAWVATYHLGSDDGYRQLTAYVDEYVPRYAAINASGDALKFEYFFPDRPVADAATYREAQAEGLRYFVLAPKDVEDGYGKITPGLAQWIRRQGRLLFTTEGNSYGVITLYEVDYGQPLTPSQEATVHTFSPAEGAPVDSLLMLMASWALLLTALGILVRDQAPSVTARRSLEVERRHA